MKTKTFKSGNSEAVRLPAEIAYGLGTELEVTRNGDIVTLRPASAGRGLREAIEQLRKMPKPEPIGPIDRTQIRPTLWDE
jgi:antitoxin VapB